MAVSAALRRHCCRRIFSCAARREYELYTSDLPLSWRHYNAPLTPSIIQLVIILHAIFIVFFGKSTYGMAERHRHSSTSGWQAITLINDRRPAVACNRRIDGQWRESAGNACQWALRAHRASKRAEPSRSRGVTGMSLHIWLNSPACGATKDMRLNEYSSTWSRRSSESISCIVMGKVTISEAIMSISQYLRERPTCHIH